MKIQVLLSFILLSSLALTAQTKEKVKDSLPLITLEEVQLIGIRANEDTPVTFSNITKRELAPRNLGQDIPILLNYLPAVVTT
ncbi:TonB-dependent receptor, partial [Flavobacteriaceae bacterium]|nr:TonB-dependent receptor [Flavobacteriaceae bacterium]